MENVFCLKNYKKMRLKFLYSGLEEVLGKCISTYTQEFSEEKRDYPIPGKLQIARL